MRARLPKCAGRLPKAGCPSSAEDAAGRPALTSHIGAGVRSLALWIRAIRGQELPRAGAREHPAWSAHRVQRVAAQGPGNSGDGPAGGWRAGALTPLPVAVLAPVAGRVPRLPGPRAWRARVSPEPGRQRPEAWERRPLRFGVPGVWDNRPTTASWH